jgi:CubicO group peptidase (beta-lactamase class C family)
MKNYQLPTLVALLLLCLSVSARQKTDPSVTPAGIDSMLTELNKAIVELKIPGLMIAIVNKSGTLYAGGVGYADLERKTKVDGQTKFRFASVTKMFTALAIQRLISEGKFKLDDQLKKIAPEIPFENAWENTNPVTVVHLLEHTAGFEDVHLGRMISKDGKSLKGLEALNFHRNSLVSRWKPGERMSYANPGYEVLGYLIEKFSGMGVDQYIEKYILLLLNMENSAILMNTGMIKNLSTAYHFGGDGFQTLPPYTLASNGATGNLVSCADDISKYMISLLHDHQRNSGENIIPENYAMEMDSLHSALAAKRGLQTGYALGNVVFANNKKLTFRGHQGLGEGFSSWIFYNKEHGIAYAIVNNSGANNWRISQIIESFLTRDLPDVHPQASNESLDRFQEFAGFYTLANPKNERLDFLQRTFNTVDVSLSDQKIILKNSRGGIDTLIHVGKNLFRMRSEIIPTFVLSTTDDGTLFIQGYNTSLFYTKAAKLPIVAKQYLFYTGLVAMVVGMLLTVNTGFLLIFKKINYKRFSLLAMPGLAALSGLLAYRKMIITDEVNKMAFSTINTTTLFIFFASRGFGLLTMVSLWLLIKQWDILRNKLVKVLLTLTILMLCYLTGIFLLNGWIGMRVWV